MNACTAKWITWLHTTDKKCKVSYLTDTSGNFYKQQVLEISKQFTAYQQNKWDTPLPAKAEKGKSKSKQHFNNVTNCDWNTMGSQHISKRKAEQQCHQLTNQKVDLQNTSRVVLIKITCTFLPELEFRQKLLSFEPHCMMDLPNLEQKCHQIQLTVMPVCNHCNGHDNVIKPWL
jgi:hypothetical protein